MESEIATEMEPEDIAPAPEAAQPQPASKPRSRKLMLGGIAALLLAGAAGGGYMLFAPNGESHTAAAENSVDAYVEVPPMTVNLRVPGEQVRFLKLRFVILATDDVHGAAIKAKIPVVLDALQPFLRELRPEDLNGSAAVFRVKEEMMVRARSTFGEGAVRDILIQDLVQQ